VAASNQEIYEALVAMGKARYPGFEVLPKEDSTAMKILDKILFFTPDFMTRFTTTMGSKVYAPAQRRSSPTFWKTIAHELVHIHDKTHAPLGMFGFGFWYLVPQILAAFALLAIPLAFVSLHFLWLLLLLPLAAPIPSMGRTHYEMRGYAMSMAVNYWRYGSVQQHQIDHNVKNFIGPAYYFMWPFESGVRKQLDEWVDKMEDGSILEDPIFKDVHDLLAGLGVANA
jgi:hypothetical protein